MGQGGTNTAEHDEGQDELKMPNLEKSCDKLFKVSQTFGASYTVLFDWLS